MEAQRILHPTLTATRRRELFWQGIELFNQGSFFDSHESWEEIWRSTTPEPRNLFQGLIQIAAGMYHYSERGRPHVASRVLAKGRRRLETVSTRCCGLDVEGLLVAVEGWEEWLKINRGESPPPLKVEVLDPSAVG